jgi:hypothetical protein
MFEIGIGDLIYHTSLLQNIRLVLSLHYKNKTQRAKNCFYPHTNKIWFEEHKSS